MKSVLFQSFFPSSFLPTTVTFENALFFCKSQVNSGADVLS